MAKKTKGKSEWKTKTLAEVEIDGKTWRAQKLKSPKGEVMYGIRAFMTSSSGKEVTLRHGFTLPEHVCTPKSISGINKLLKAIFEEVSE